MEIDFKGKKAHVIEYYKARKSGWDDEIEELKEWAMREHFEKIKKSDAILVVNPDKDGKKNYIGGNTLLEMGLAFFLNKKIHSKKPNTTRKMQPVSYFIFEVKEVAYRQTSIDGTVNLHNLMGDCQKTWLLSKNLR
ncbi:MAG: hypothetical protein ACE5HX_06710, partial [bacterium]